MYFPRGQHISFYEDCHIGLECNFSSLQAIAQWQYVLGMSVHMVMNMIISSNVVLIRMNWLDFDGFRFKVDVTSQIVFL